MTSTQNDQDLTINLRSNLDLIDPHFDRYVLTNAKYAVKKVEITPNALFVAPSQEQFSYQHAKTFSGVERLIVESITSAMSDDTTTVDICYLFDEARHLIAVVFDKAKNFFMKPVRVAEFEAPIGTESNNENVYLPTLALVDASHAFVADGCGVLTLYATGDRRAPSSWTKLDFDYDDADVPMGVLIDARSTNKNGQLKCVELLQQTVVGQRNERLGKIVFTTNFIWLTIERKSESKFTVVRRRELASDGRVEFATLNATADAIFVVCNVAPIFISDSQASGQKNADATGAADEKAKNQTLEDQEVLQQKEAEREEQAAKMNGDKAENLAAEDTSPLFNAEQLEECDQPTDAFTGYFVHGETHKLIGMVDFAGSQILFTTRSRIGAPLDFAIRSDVDALLWRFDENRVDSADSVASKTTSLFRHIATLQAFGYIQAGHSDKLLTSCSPNGGYAIIVNRKNHVFLYFQKAEFDKDIELKNRKTGAVKYTIAKQVVFSLAKSDPTYNVDAVRAEYLGARATDEHLYLLTKDRLVAVCLKAEEESGC